MTISIHVPFMVFQISVSNEVVTVTLSKTVINFRRRDGTSICMEIMKDQGIPQGRRGLLSTYYISFLQIHHILNELSNKHIQKTLSKYQSG